MKKIALAAVLFAGFFLGTLALGEITGVTVPTTSPLDLRTKMNVEFLKCRDEIAAKANSTAEFTGAFLSDETTLLGAIQALGTDIDNAVTITAAAPLNINTTTGVLSIDPTHGLPHVASGYPPVGACNWNTTDKKIYCRTSTNVWASAAMTLVQ
ncbi:MAG: hypothetical protein V3573_14445 [Desulfovibrionaceae bacterium]